MYLSGKRQHGVHESETVTGNVYVGLRLSVPKVIKKLWKKTLKC